MKKQKTFAIGDIHGRFEALKEVLKKSKFNYNKDKLIILGDIVDGGYNTDQVVEELLKIKNTIFIIGNHDCVGKGTEVLTENGWEKIEQWKGSKVAQYDLKTSEITFAKPIAYIQSGKQECLIIESMDTKQIISKDHNIIMNNKKVKLSDLIGIQIKNISLPNTGFSNNSLDLSDDLIRLYTWIITDGCLYESTPNKVKVQFKLSKIRKIKELKKLLDRLKIPYKFNKASMSPYNKLQPYTIIFYGQYSRDVRDYLKGVKEIPSEWKNLSRRQLEIFFETIIMTDGSIVGNNIKWSSINKNNMDIIQEACVKNGLRTKIDLLYNVSGFKNGNPRYDMVRYIGKRKNFTVNVKPFGIEETYCFTMPKETLVTRYDGKVAITGNCWFMNYIKTGLGKEMWLQQGGANTLRSYGAKVKEGKYYSDKTIVNTTNIKIHETHKEFFNSGKYYHIENNMIFVHAGFDPNIPIENNTEHNLIWNRWLIEHARAGNIIKGYDKVFVGHTTTQHIMYDNDYCEPVRFGNLYCLDCGAGWTGKLCIYDVNSDEHWLSQKQEPAESLYECKYCSKCLQMTNCLEGICQKCKK